MPTIHFDSVHDDAERLNRLYQGDFYVRSPTDTTLAFCDFARSMIEEAFGELPPETAQYKMPVAEYAELLQRLKPSFIHHPQSKTFIQKILVNAGCDPDKTYFEIPKMRTSTSDGYLTAGIAYAWHPHRDTWYSVPQCQINWWMPIFPITAENCMAFHPRYFDEAIENTSASYNYYEWNAKHRGAQLTQFVKKDPRPLPKATMEVDKKPDLRLVCPVGGLILFSGAHLHSTVPNNSGKTRFSLDFRTVHLDDLENLRGAPNVDSRCSGTVLREFCRVADFANFPDDVIQLYQDGTERYGIEVYGKE